MKVKVKSLSHVRLFATPWTVALQAPPSMGFSRQECWSGLPFPSPGDLPNPGIEPRSPALQADTLTSEPPGIIIMCKFLYVSAHVYISLKKYAPFIWLLMGSISRKGKNHWIRPGLVSISFDLLLSQTLFTHMDSLQCCVSRATLKNHSLARKWRNA